MIESLTFPNIWLERSVGLWVTRLLIAVEVIVMLPNLGIYCRDGGDITHLIDVEAMTGESVDDLDKRSDFGIHDECD